MILPYCSLSAYKKMELRWKQMCLYTNIADSLHLFVMVLGCRELKCCEKICDVRSSGTSTPESRVEGERSMVNVFITLFVVLFSTMEDVLSWLVVFWWVWGQGTESFWQLFEWSWGHKYKGKENSLESLHYAQDIVSITSIALMARVQAQGMCKHAGALPWWGTAWAWCQSQLLTCKQSCGATTLVADVKGGSVNDWGY